MVEWCRDHTACSLTSTLIIAHPCRVHQRGLRSSSMMVAHYQGVNRVVSDKERLISREVLAWTLAGLRQASTPRLVQTVVEAYYRRQSVRAFYRVTRVQQQGAELGRLLYPQLTSSQRWWRLGQATANGFYASREGLRWQSSSHLESQEQSFATLARYERLVPGCTARVKLQEPGHCLLLVAGWPLPAELLAGAITALLEKLDMRQLVVSTSWGSAEQYAFDCTWQR